MTLSFFPRTKSTFATTLNSVNPYDYVSNSEVRIFYKDEPPSNPTFWQFFKRMRERTPVLDGVIFRSGNQTFTDTNPLITCFGEAVHLQAYAQYHIDLANETVTFEIPVPVKFVDPALNLHNDQVYLDKTGTILTALKPGAYDIEAIFPPGDSLPPEIPKIARVISQKLELTIDSNNDGKVDDDDDLVEDSSSFVFWVNDDDNSNSDANNHQVYSPPATNLSPSHHWNCNADEVINGAFDLIDFAPLKIHVDQLTQDTLSAANLKVIYSFPGSSIFCFQQR